MKSPIKLPLCAAGTLLLAGQLLFAHDPHDPFQVVATSPNYTQDLTVFAASDNLALREGIYLLLKSTDGGVTWAIIQNMPNNGQMNAMAFSPSWAQDQTFYVAGVDGLFQTTNGGISWSVLTHQSLLSVALSPGFATDNTVFIVTSKQTILKSGNRGKTWSTIPPPPLTAGLSVIALSPNFLADRTILLGSAADGIFKSSTAGSSWIQATAGLTLPTVTAIAFSPAFSTDRTAYAGTLGAGFLKTATGGSSWAFSNTGITDQNVTSIVLDPGYLQDSTLWISTAVSGVFQSTTLGTSWNLWAKASRSLSNLTTVHYQTMATGTGAGGTVLFLGMFEGLWTASASSASWLYIDTLPTRLIGSIILSPNFANDQTLFAGTYGGGVIRSTDGGADWTFQNVGLVAGYALGGNISPNFAADQTAWAADVKGLQRTNDGGATWQSMPGPGVSIAARTVAVSPNFAQDDTVLIGTEQLATHPDACPPPTAAPASGASSYSGAFVSKDGGSTWLSTNLTGVTGIDSFAISPGFATDQTAFAASAQTQLYKSTNGGMNWAPITLPPADQKIATVAVTPSFSTDHTVFVAMLVGGIFKSMDAGTTWTELPQTANLRALQFGISPDYAVDQTLFAGTLQQGLVEFTQGGTKMTVTSFPDRYTTAVGLSPNFANDRTLFAAGYHGIYKSANGGSTWTYLDRPARIEESRQAHSHTAPEDPPSITYSGEWSSFTATPVASTSYYMLSKQPEATAVLNFSGSGVAWVSWTGPEQGSAAIELDGVSQGTVSLNAPLDQYQQIVWEQLGLACGLHTLSITALPTKGQTVSLDAFNVWVDTCPVVAEKPNVGRVP
jgi:photosystem II stability/assembly factor-like uncharacterized protein